MEDPAAPCPRYEGELTVALGDDGRTMLLKAPFSFIDAQPLRRDVPARAQIDGASIPISWSVTGSLYVGKYRAASVVHDNYCSIRTRSHSATHRMA